MKQKNDIDLFGLIYLSALCVAFICGAVLFSVCILISIFIKEEYPISSNFTVLELIVLMIICYIVLLSILLYQGRFLRLYLRDKRKNDYTEETVSLVTSKSFSKGSRFEFLPNMICLFYWKERANYHVLNFKSLDSGKMGKVSYILTKDKSKIYGSLYDIKCSYWDLNLWIRSIEFNGEIPLVLVYGRKSRYLKEIRLADGYCYSDEQVKLVESWNLLSL